MVGEGPCFAHFLDEKGRMPEVPYIQLRRVYDRPSSTSPGEIRILVDPVWPRGVANASLKLDRWAKDLAPSNELRRWFGHDPKKWSGFQSRYRHELADKTAMLRELAELSRAGSLVLLYSARDEEHNQAVVIKDVLEEGIRNS